MQKQNGFTLIELVVVIIILGILAVTAAPKFINLQSDARASALQGVKGAIQGANGLVFAKAALAGDERASAAAGTDVNIGTDAAPINVKTIYGYLIAKEADFSKAMDVNFALSTATDAEKAAADWIIEESGTSAIIHQVGAPNDSNTCQVTYEQADASNVPTYTIVDTGC
ncbi:prepilin-type N-terminal cleavage/methylation domain-containing protein [Shewanella schlegeliana]|uniref:Prepilin-type N-terminal cleavage/methylation domain-containing protein n=1 Tax=Shewanella schlegeliana TaxID=190308 RepID=A0ABS1SYB8_9GAMM|nr:prepilin-type N-terminal cleavage/methylation domain-containing protein [Shewanella schlegeliana]MBL4913010.1 prepilin-type N-terminal cleavage/methylation domain-containing protein [Shewanella schlegeliana]MCL1108894.1 prepilin-type N-terminal cleavage/methylation domain-containing protein [Shewanella schlegeliana]GIU23794.1 hypothetical protein TUM4433_06820 [Shewanella schlegeliana]